MAASVITIFKNGDNFQNGKRLVLNRKEIRSFDAFLDRVTKDTQSQVAVRSIRTPSYGHRVADLDKLENGGIYVAVGPERFKKLEYKEISNLPFSKPKPPEQIIKPVVHSRVIVSGRARKVAAAETTANKTIFVFRNGDDKQRPFKLLLDKRLLHTAMDTILQFITEKVRLQTGRAIRTLYTLDGAEISEPSQIKSLEKYVAVGYGQKFVKLAYNENGSTSLTPRRGGPKVKSSEPPYRKKRPKPAPKAFSQGNVKSPPKSEEIAPNKQGKTSSDVNTFQNTIIDSLTQIENDIGLERSQTQELPNTPPKESTKHDNEADDLPRKESSVKEISNKGSDTSAEGLTQKKASVKEIPSKGSVASEATADGSTRKKSSVKEISSKGSDTSAEGLTQKKASVKEISSKGSVASETTADGSTRKKSSVKEISSKGSDTSAEGLSQKKASVKEISSKGSVASEAGSTRKKSSVKEVNAAESKQKLKEKIKENNEKNKAAREEKSDDVNEKENDIKDEADDEQERSDSTVFKATGDQGESAKVVKENEETSVEKPIDMLPAEEVEEELPNEDAENDNSKNDQATNDNEKTVADVDPKDSLEAAADDDKNTTSKP
eukprot:Seg213.5 transcript_id=Seg213.5/GoldUCD/mRNA.D3Y31 product="Doublecortin domain-containing protein 2" protein_id=Seg213.5/GoldUCD/D3Y31